MTTTEAAKRLGMKFRSVVRLIRDGRLAATWNAYARRFDIDPEEVERYARERTGPGMTGKKHSAETKEKMRQARLKNNPIKGKGHTPETRAKIRATQLSVQPRGDQAPVWKGGKTLNSNGYFVVYAPDHPYAVNRYVLEHRLVVEQQIGRYLDPSEIVHHINGITTDNRPENLEITSRGEHQQIHARNPHIKRKVS